MIKIWNVFAIICGILCTFAGIYYAYKKNDIKEKFMNGLFSILGLVVSVLGAESTYYYNIINVLNQQIYNLEANLTIENNSELVSAETNATENIINSHNQITNNTVFESSESNEETLMNYAKFYYTAGNLEGVVRIYGNSKLASNPIALTNLGYLYANGIYFSQNLEIAENYYNQAIALGFEQAMCNKLAMYINNKLDGIDIVLKDGFEKRNEKIAKFISSNYWEDDPEINMAMYYDFFRLSIEEQYEEIDSWYYWDDGVLVSYYETPDPKVTEKLEFIRFFDEDNRVGSLFKKYEIHCYNIEILEEKFIL